MAFCPKGVFTGDPRRAGPFVREWVMLVIDQRRCVGCGLCVAACPREAIRAYGLAVVDQERCKGCFGGILLLDRVEGRTKGFPIQRNVSWRKACVRNCPVEAIVEDQG